MIAGSQTSATLPLHPLKPVAAGGWWRRLIDTIRLWFAEAPMAAPLPICYLNGDYLPLPRRACRRSIAAFLFGDAVYEVVPVYGARPFRLREHLDRLNRSLAGIRMPRPLPHDDWARLLRSRIDRAQPGASMRTSTCR